jgi:general secretion pathway protein K
MRSRHRQEGVVLLVVLFFALLLVSSVATFTRRATVDAMISRNRESAARAEALARGGVRLATALIVDDRLQETEDELPLDTRQELWFRIAEVEDLEPSPEATLHLGIEDAGAKLNLNALFAFGEGGVLDEQTGFLLQDLLEKVIGEMDIPPGEKVYDVQELAANLIDWVDENDLRERGGTEDDYYQRQDPPYRAASRGALLSVDELRLIQGFDAKLVEALRPYVTVYPYAGGGGINLNTAPPHVLSLLFFDDGVDLVLAPKSTVRAILEARKGDGRICPEGESDEACTPMSEIVTNANTIYPPPTSRSQVFTVTARAGVGEVQRTAVAVLDFGEPAEPQLLSWSIR